MRLRPALLAALAGFAALAVAPDAAAKRFGFQTFGANYSGGYSVTMPDATTSGPSKIRIFAPRNGESARMTWSNTFYDEHGSFTISMRWIFRANGRFIASSLDPRHTWISARGTFTLDRNHPVLFTASNPTGTVHMSGQLAMIGGGALGIAVTLTGLPEGDGTFGFSGSRQTDY